MKLVDVNVLLFVVNDQAVQHEKARRWWESNLLGTEPIGLSWMTISGFLRLSTNPRVFNAPLAVSEALEQIDRWLEFPSIRIVEETEEHWRIMRRFVDEVGTAGNLTSDAHLAALADSLGATVATCDNDFARFRGLRWENPLDSP